MTDDYDQSEHPPVLDALTDLFGRRETDADRERPLTVPNDPCQRPPVLAVLADQFASRETHADRERPLTVPNDRSEQLPGLAVLTDAFAGRETDADRQQPLTVPEGRREPAGDATTAPARPERRRARRRRTRGLLPVGTVALMLTVAAVLVLLQLRGTSGALANPSQAAEAAEHARTFSFSTTSRLSFAGITTAESRTDGEVNLAGEGAFKVRVLSEHAIGFERIVFPTAVYIRGIGAHGPRAWRGVHIKPRLTINARTPSGGGLADPFVLFGALARQHGAHLAGTAFLDNQHTRHYTLALALTALLPPQTNVRPALRKTSVKIDVWQNSEQQLVRAVRVFDIGGPRREQLTIQTDFSNYRKPITIQPPPGIEPVGTVALNSTADDPLGASLLGVVAAGTGRGPTPFSGAAQTATAPAPNRAP